MRVGGHPQSPHFYDRLAAALLQSSNKSWLRVSECIGALQAKRLRQLERHAVRRNPMWMFTPDRRAICRANSAAGLNLDPLCVRSVHPGGPECEEQQNCWLRVWILQSLFKQC